MGQVRLLDQPRAAGVPGQCGRASAIRQRVLQAPAPVAARALDYHDKTTTRLVTETGGTWSRYAPGDHIPSRGRTLIRDEREGSIAEWLRPALTWES
jgi:hypothetical protein